MVNFSTAFSHEQTSVQTGRYEFNDIDLLFGENDFEMILYGPQGQVENEYKAVFVDKNVLSSSESSYSVSVSQLGKSLLGIDNFTQPDTEGVLVSIGELQIGFQLVLVSQHYSVTKVIINVSTALV